MLHLTAEAAVPEGHNDEPALAERGIGLCVAVPAKRDQPVEVEVRAALGALDHVVHLEAVRGETAGLAPPPGAGHNLGSDLAPGLETR